MTDAEHFHGTDPTGLQTLERFANATHFNQWMFDTIRPYCKGHVLEVGSGIGNISRLFLEHSIPLTVTDLRAEYCQMLQQKFGHHPFLRGIASIDLAIPDFKEQYNDQLQQFDTVIALNVIEHIEDAERAINNCKQLLRPGGHLVILVPAYQSLYNLFDVELGHYVRYTAKSLTHLLKSASLDIIHRQYFNAVGIAGWMVNGRILRKRLIPRKQLQLFDKLMPVIKLIDALTFHKIGLSVIAVGRKTS
jgi:2-polyprenyl-3-methyl-5-hydroxy-6-metoxy-1,4-benzoquinol methylase